MEATKERLIGVGIYSVPEAARLSEVSSACVHRWIRGYTYKKQGLRHTSPPVWHRQLSLVDGKAALGFLDLIEVRFVQAFRHKGVRWRTIRRAHKQASQLFETAHPFATNRFKTDGFSIFVELVSPGTGIKALLDVPKSQFAFDQIIAPYLQGVVFDHGLATQWWPLGEDRAVVIDPARRFGQPIVDREGVPTSVLAQAVRTEGSAEAVARCYEVDVRAVRDAVEFENKRAA